MDERSHWAWGLAHKFPDAQARGQLGRLLAAVLGVLPPSPTEPVAEGDCAVRASGVAVPASLAEVCTTDVGVRLRHTHGRSFLDQYRGFLGDFRSAPDVVARPEDEDALVAVLRWAASAGLVVVPWGGGTSVVEGLAPREEERRGGVVVLSLRGMNRLLALDTVSGLAHLQAGMTGPEVEAALAPHGLTLRHFPQSFEFSTVGLAGDAGRGHFATLYTHIDELTAGIRLRTATGAVWESRPLPGSGAGPSPDRLVLGSEGTLGVITSGWLRVRPRPRFRASAGVHFRSFEAAVEATRAVAQSGLYPSGCRLLDPTEALLNQVATDGSAVLLLAFESAHRSVRGPLEEAVRLAEAAGGRLPRPVTVQDDGEAKRDAAAATWRKAFLDGPYLQSTLISLGMAADTFETACTWAAFPALHAAVKAAVKSAFDGRPGRLSCRFTHVYPDGPAPYYTWITPMADDVPAQWAAVKGAASEALLAHGATITHHHAVGRMHRPWYDRQRPEPFAEALRAARKALDPQGILNPGVLTDADGG
ncbi:MAG: FAD-binding oxidoreductase [bacterium]